MAIILVNNADVLVTMNRDREEIKNGSVIIEGNQIRWVGAGTEVENYLIDHWPDAERRGFDVTIDATGCVVIPGLVNCHHHLSQSLTRAIGTGQGKSLFSWLKYLYPIWAEMTPEAVKVSAQVGLVELVLSGCTTVADHLYLFPNGSKLDDEIQAAEDVGVRFHPTRGSISIGESQGGLAPDRVCENEADIIRDSLRVIECFHDPEPFSMLRIGLAPSALFEVSADLMRESAELARAYPMVNLHTHLGETQDEYRYSMEVFNKRPIEYAESCNWYGEDVWFAHMVHPSQAEISWLSKTRTGICHCPTSNMILASGIAPIREMVDKNVRVGLGVDGSASNDGNHMLAETRLAMLLQRVGWPGFESHANRFTAREALELATLGGAQVLRRNDVGALSPGMAADLVAFRVDDLAHAGGRADPVASLLTCAPTQAWLTIINGEIIVRDGQFLPFELEPMIERHNQLSLDMVENSGIGFSIPVP